MLSIRGIDVFESDRRRFQILHKITLDVAEGEFITILGKSGSGKSTLLNVLGGIAHPQSGEVMFQGNNIYTSQRTTQQFIYHHVGFVFQNYNLIENLTGYENIELALRIRHMPISRPDVIEFASLFEVTEVMDKLPFEMSGGQKQRVSVIRTLMLHPDIVLCDEPTGALDSGSAQLVIQQLTHIHNQLQKTIVMVTHEESYAALANRVIRLKDGRIDSIIENPVAEYYV